jgi:ssDNA-binding Zn-finger/Zn-ribbon topoisomerase 1
MCSNCGHRGLAFNNDGTGSCPNCGNTFFWDKSRVPATKRKPSGGKCSACGHTGLQFNDDGTGFCPGCAHAFIWDKSRAPASPPPAPATTAAAGGATGLAGVERLEKSLESIEGEVEAFECPECGNKIGEDDPECPNCGAVFEEDEEEFTDESIEAMLGEEAAAEIEVTGGGTLAADDSGLSEAEVLAEEDSAKEGAPVKEDQTDIKARAGIAYKSAYVIYKVKVENESQSPIGEVTVTPFISNDIFIIDESQRNITLIKPREAKTVTFKLRPRGECGNVRVFGKVTYYDYMKNDYGELKVRPRTTSIVCPMIKVKEIDETTWRKEIEKLITVEESSEVPMQAEQLFELVNDVVKDMNMYLLEPKVIKSPPIVRCKSLFYSEGIQGFKYAAMVEVVGGEAKSKLIIKAYAPNEETLIGFYFCLLDEIEKRTKIKEFIVDDMVEQDVKTVEAERKEVKKEKRILDKGFSHLVYEEKPEKTYQMFANLVKEGLPGLVISTTFPDKIRSKHELWGTEIYWLTDSSSTKDTMNPKRLDFEITREMLNYIKEKEDPAVLLDGLEYLVLENGFNKVIKFVKRVNDAASMEGATIVMPINPRSFEERQLNVLKRSFDKGG